MQFAHNGANFDGEPPILDKNPPLEKWPPNLRTMCVKQYRKIVLTHIYGLVAQNCVKV